MSRIMIGYGTCEGHTGRIAGYLADAIRRAGHEPFPIAIERVDAAAPDGYDGVIVGASVHRGRHQAAVRDFARKHRTTLERLPTAFFSVSLAVSGGTPAGRAEAEGYVEEFFRQTGWRPVQVRLFAGALLYTRYGFVTRWIMKRIVIAKGSRDTDTSRDYVYTDWDEVKRFAAEFLARAPARSCDLTAGAKR